MFGLEAFLVSLRAELHDCNGRLTALKASDEESRKSLKEVEKNLKMESAKVCRISPFQSLHKAGEFNWA